MNTLPDPLERESRNWAVACHLAGLLGYIGFATGLHFIVPFSNIFAPLLLWLIKKDQLALVDDQGREAVNFNISMTIYGFVCLMLSFVLIGIPALITLPFVHVFLVVIAASRAANGERHRYPFTIRFVN